MTLRFTHADGLVYRVGYSPDPWAWVPWEYSPFTGRWDDPEALFRTIYAASSAERPASSRSWRSSGPTRGLIQISPP